MNTQVMVVGSAKTKDIRRRRPRIRLSGFWLNDIGFTCDSLIEAEYSRECIALKLEGSGVDTYNRVVKGLLRHNMGLLQVKGEIKNNKRTPSIEVKGFWLEEYGFKVGSVIVVESEQGCITIKLLDIDSVTSKKASCLFQHKTSAMNNG